MKVLFLGAGASVAAGYPLTRSLMAEVEKESLGSRDVMVERAWSEWDAFRREASPGPFGPILTDPNPEVILSLLDLCAEAKASGPDAFRKEHRDAAVGLGLSEFQVPVDWFESEGHRLVSQAHVARNRLLYCLESFFEWRHIEDSEQRYLDRRNYLRDILRPLDPDDLVITLNWDSTVERTLFEMGRWSPLDGYGFRKVLNADPPSLAPITLKRIARESEILVLKLHGSVGWYRVRPGDEIYFDGDNFLPGLIDVDEVPLHDPQEPIGPHLDRVLLYPSFLKQIVGHQMEEVWYKASEALRRADMVEAWGYSLPASDSAVRGLLIPLRFRLQARDVNVCVHDPSGEVRNRWQNALGDLASVDPQKLE